MISIHTRITVRDRDYLDAEIKKGRFASYGHALRALLHYYKVMHRENAKLRSENARMKGIQEVLERGTLAEIRAGKLTDHRTYTNND